MPRVLSNAEIADFREKLVDVATGLFAKKGREDFSMRELAGALGVSPMTPYRYFKDKEEILAAVRASAFDRFAEALEAAFAAVADELTRPETAFAAAGAVADAYVNFALSEPQSYRLMFDVSQEHMEAYPELVRAADRARATMTRHIAPLIAAGLIKGDPFLIGHVYWAALHGTVMLKLSGNLGGEYGIERILGESFRALSVGFAP